MNKKLQRLLMGIVSGLDLSTENNQLKDIYKMQKIEKDKLLDEVADIIIDNQITDSRLDVNAKQRKKLKKKLSKKLVGSTKNSIKIEKDLMNELLQSNAVERYLINTYFYNETFETGYDMKKLSDVRVKEIVDTKIKGENWSSRLNRNKKQLEQDLRKELYGFMDGKTDINATTRMIEDKYGQSFGKSRTLVRTEAARVQGQVNEEWAKDNGVEQQIWTATLDNLTSKICQDLDGNFYDFDDPDKPVKPMHPNCRSAMLNVPFEGWKPTVRRDNITGKNINYKTYKEWEKDN